VKHHSNQKEKESGRTFERKVKPTIADTKEGNKYPSQKGVKEREGGREGGRENSDLRFEKQKQAVENSLKLQAT